MRLETMLSVSRQWAVVIALPIALLSSAGGVSNAQLTENLAPRK